MEKHWLMLSKKSSAWQNGCALTRLVSLLTQWSPTPERWNAMVKADPTAYPDVVRLIDAEYKAKNGGKSPIINATSAVSSTGGATSLKDYRDALRRGDQASRDKVLNTSKEQLDEWARA